MRFFIATASSLKPFGRTLVSRSSHRHSAVLLVSSEASRESVEPARQPDICCGGVQSVAQWQPLGCLLSAMKAVLREILAVQGF